MKIAACWLLLMFASTVFAEEGSKRWSGDSELGLVKTSGNSNSESLKARQSLVFDARPWRNTLKMEATNVSSETTDATTGAKVEQRTSEKYYASEQIDYFFTDRSYSFLRATFDKNRFSGFDSQVTTLLGYGRTLLDNDAIDMKMEVGFGQSRDRIDACSALPCDPDAGEAHRSGLAYLSEELEWHLTEHSGLGQSLSVEETRDDRKSRFLLFLKSQLFNSLAMKVAYSLKHSDEVPTGQRHKDEELTASLVYSF